MIMINVLTKGILLRGMIILLLVPAMIFRLFYVESDDKTIFAVGIIIFVLNIYLWGMVGQRVLLLSQNGQAKATPNYFLLLKRAIYGLLLCSMLTTTIMLPDVAMTLSLMSWILAVFLFFAFGYIYPQIWIVFSVVWVLIALNAKLLSNIEAGYWLTQVPAYLLPVLTYSVYRIVNAIEHYPVKEEIKLRFSAYSGLSMSDAFSSSDKMPEKSTTEITKSLQF